MATTTTPTLPLNSFATDSPQPRAAVASFKFRLSIPGRNIGGDWLCRLTGAAMAYQNYCGTQGSPRVFSWVRHRDQDYLQDQDGHWLSYDALDNCLYMSAWMNAVAWKLDGGHLVRASDGAVVTYRAKQRWPLADEKFLQALPMSDEAVTVQQVAD